MQSAENAQEVSAIINEQGEYKQQNKQRDLIVIIILSCLAVLIPEPELSSKAVTLQQFLMTPEVYYYTSLIEASAGILLLLLTMVSYCLMRVSHRYEYFLLFVGISFSFATHLILSVLGISQSVLVLDMDKHRYVMSVLLFILITGVALANTFQKSHSVYKSQIFIVSTLYTSLTIVLYSQSYLLATGISNIIMLANDFIKIIVPSVSLVGLLLLIQYHKKIYDSVRHFFSMIMIPLSASVLYSVYCSLLNKSSEGYIEATLNILTFIIIGLGCTNFFRNIYKSDQEKLIYLREKNQTLVNESKELIDAKYHLKNVAEFVSALNQTNQNITYHRALTSINRLMHSPISILYILNETNDLKAVSANACDESIIDKVKRQANGLVYQALKSEKTVYIYGPFEQAHLNIDIGVGGIDVISVSAWPLAFQDSCIGVILLCHTMEPSEEQKILLRDYLEQLAVRVNNYRIDDLRKRLVKDLKSQSKALTEANEKAVKASRHKSEFLASMSHELRTPLNSIIGFTNRLINRLSYSINEKDLDALMTVSRNGKSLMYMINDLLDISKIEAGKIDLSFEDFNLIELIQEIMEELSPMIDDKSIRLEQDFEMNSLIINADKIKIRQIIVNLYSNAIKYTDEGKIVIKVELSEDSSKKEPSQHVVVRVIDSGIGIKGEDKEKLFRKFSRIENENKKISGTGLGLVIASEFASMHDGKIDFESTYNKGSEFKLTLPIEANRKVSGQKNKSSDDFYLSESFDSMNKVNLFKESKNKAIRLLFVDSEPDSLKYYQDVFGDEGYDVLLADGYNSGIFQAVSRRPNLICVDTDLIGKSGADFIYKIATISQLQGIPIIVISSQDSDFQKVKSHVSLCLRKPVSEEELLYTVNGALKNNQGDIQS